MEQRIGSHAPKPPARAVGGDQTAAIRRLPAGRFRVAFSAQSAGALRHLAILVLLCAGSGATCLPWTRPGQPAGPVVYDHTPTLGEVMAKVNAATQAVRTLRAESVRLSAPGLPSVKARLYYAAPRQFRLLGDLMLAREIDIGMNQELFWFWGRNWTGALYYARHDQTALPQVSERIGIEPGWLLEALGLVELDPAGQHHGPYAHGPGTMEIHTQRLTPSGQIMTRVMVLHAVYGWILEVRLHDERGNILAQAKMSQHRFYENPGVTLPDRVEVHLAPGMPDSLQLRLDIGGYVVNEPISDPGVFTLPQLSDVKAVNLATSPSQPPVATPNSSHMPATIPEAFRPEYRGYTRR
ncbi:MAG: hypothetical protein KatS3mg110_3185 [Pirellulaceae bacterium]|nr:MAG: hypothetical protein KatS3mg110_3185 [Pirellulaceae bacterium]